MPGTPLDHPEGGGRSTRYAVARLLVRHAAISLLASASLATSSPPVRPYSFVQVGTRPGVQGAPAFSIAPSRVRRSVSTSARKVASCFSKASDAVA
jgi:hypothetical protein